LPNSRPNLRDLSLPEIEALFTQKGLPAFRGRQVFRWLSVAGVDSFQQMTDLPKELRRDLEREFSIALPELARQEVSRDGTRKLALRLEDGEIIECVLIPERDHYTLCVSSQVGCAMGCAFCLTGRMGFRRNLSAGEITSQVLKAQEILSSQGLDKKKPLRNLVFMGMGEPLANYEAVIKALNILLYPKGFDFSPRRVTVSTVGLVPQIRRLGQEIRVKLAVSLHAADDQIRTSLVPVNKKYPLEEIIKACKSFPLKRGWRITFEYVLLAGINDSLVQAQRLAKLLRGVPAKINLIPFNEAPSLPFKRPDDKTVLAFQEILMQAGYVATVRQSKGQDIAAACGQLRGVLS